MSGLARRGGAAPALVLAGAMALASTSRAQTLPASTSPENPALAVSQIDEKIAALDAKERSDKEELAGLGSQMAGDHARVLAHGRELYKLTRAGLLPVGGGFEAFVRYAMHVERARRQVIGDLEQEVRQRSRAASLAGDIERMARDRASLQTQRASADAARLAAEDERRRRLAFNQAFQTSTGASDYIAVYGGTGLVSEPPAGGFAAARGRLLFPVAARAEVRGARRAGAGGPGLDIQAPAGSVVRAVYAGRVAFADSYEPYGRIVLLDHGDHYFTMSGNLDEIDVKVGQEVGAGERVGTVGDDGQGAMLYFEVRHGSEVLAPGAWLGIDVGAR